MINGYLCVNVWLVYKAGEPRVYSRTTEPDADQRAAYRRDGFKIYKTCVFLPEAEPTGIVGTDTCKEVTE